MKYHKQYRARRLKQILHHYEMIRWCNRHNLSMKNNKPNYYGTMDENFKRQRAEGWLEVHNNIEKFAAMLRKRDLGLVPCEEPDINLISNGGSVNH